MFGVATDLEATRVDGAVVLSTSAATALAERADVAPDVLEEAPNFTDMNGDVVLGADTALGLAEALARTEALALGCR